MCHVTFKQQIGTDRFGKWTQAFAKAFHLIGKSKLGTLTGGGGGDAPCNRAFIGNAHNKAAFASQK